MEWLENDGMGVCGYTWDQVQEMPIQAIARAISARNRFAKMILRAFLGEPEPDPVKEASRPLTAVFDLIFPGRSE